MPKQKTPPQARRWDGNYPELASWHLGLHPTVEEAANQLAAEIKKKIVATTRSADRDRLVKRVSDQQVWLTDAAASLLQDIAFKRASRERRSAATNKRRLKKVRVAAEKLLSEIQMDRPNKRPGGPGAESTSVLTKPSLLEAVVALQPKSHPLWAINSGIPGRGIRLWKNWSSSEVSLEDLLEQLIAVCSATAKLISGEKGAKGRPELIPLVKGLAEIWTKLTGRRFSKNVTSLSGVPGLSNPDQPEFKMPGPRFVCEIAQVIDPSITFKQIRSALKGLPVAKADKKTQVKKRRDSRQTPN